MTRGGETGQAFVETLLMVWLLTLLLSAIFQVFLVHNYTFQMANNAYYSLFKDKAYGQHNDPDKEFAGFPNWNKKPLRTVVPLQQAGGHVHDLSGGPGVSWSEDDRAAVPMMPYFEDSIIEQLQNAGVTRAPVRLKIGSPVPGHNYLDHKFLNMAMGTEGGFEAFANMIAMQVLDGAVALRHRTDVGGDHEAHQGARVQNLDDVLGEGRGEIDDDVVVCA